MSRLVKLSIIYTNSPLAIVFGYNDKRGDSLAIRNKVDKSC